MRPLLRLTALLVQLLILQGAFLGGGPACALAQLPAARIAAEGASPAPYHGAHHATAAAGAHDRSSRAAPRHDGEQPGQQDRAPAHCLAAGACVTAAIGGRTIALPASVEIAAARADVAEFDAPRSLGTAPEPPPPRA